MTQPPPGGPDNVRRLSDKQPVGLVPGIELEEPEPEEPTPVPPDYSHVLHALADSLAADLQAERDAHEARLRVLEVQLAQVVEQRDWAFVNRDTHYQRLLQLEEENAELRARLGER